jgi:hypothetical protein
MYRISTVFLNGRCHVCAEPARTMKLVAEIWPSSRERRRIPRPFLDWQSCAACGFRRSTRIEPVDLRPPPTSPSTG